MIAARPDRVLLFVPDLLPEVRAAYPEIERNGGLWVVMDPAPRKSNLSNWHNDLFDNKI